MRFFGCIYVSFDVHRSLSWFTDVSFDFHASLLMFRLVWVSFDVFRSLLVSFDAYRSLLDYCHSCALMRWQTSRCKMLCMHVRAASHKETYIHQKRPINIKRDQKTHVSHACTVSLWRYGASSNRRWCPHAGDDAHMHAIVNDMRGAPATKYSQIAHTHACPLKEQQLCPHAFDLQSNACVCVCNLRIFGLGSASPHRNWESGERIPSPNLVRGSAAHAF